MDGILHDWDNSINRIIYVRLHIGERSYVIEGRVTEYLTYNLSSDIHYLETYCGIQSIHAIKLM